jgi:hypothetical protein
MGVLTKIIGIPYNLYLVKSWGRTGFDGDNETKAACRGSAHLVKKVDQTKCRTTASCCLTHRYAVSLALSCGA